MNKELYATVYSTYIGRYVTRIFTNTNGDVYQCDGTTLDLEGKIQLLALKTKGYDIAIEQCNMVGYASEITKSK